MMRIIVLFLVVLLLLGACSTEMSCSGPGRDTLIPIDDPAVFAQPAWSPDGKTIAVAWSGVPTARKQGIYLIDTADWTADTLLIAQDDYSTPFFNSPTWSATGEWLAFAASAQIYKIKTNGDSLTQLTYKDRHWFCDWSDSDTLIVYNISIGDSGGVWLMDTDGGNKRLLVRYGSHFDFAVGDSVLFIESLPSNRKFSHMVLINPVDSSTREVYKWEKGKPYDYYDQPKVSPDGRTIVLMIQGNIWTMTIEGQNLRQLTTDLGRYPNWSPDGSKIVYFKPSKIGGTLCIMNADGSEKTHIEGW